MSKVMKYFGLGLFLFGHTIAASADLPTSKRLERVQSDRMPDLRAELREAGLILGAPIFIRIFKKERQLEVWMEGAGGRLQLFRTFGICSYSGKLGPKLKEGDRQAPEGFYRVGPSEMNPNSQYHLSFNLGFPNAYDRAHGRTGSYLMVHGSCVSVGCYAMTNKGIEEIYLLASAALKEGQPNFNVHIFPFRMTGENMRRHEDSRWFGFWQNLKEGFDAFEEENKVPEVAVKDGTYVVGLGGS